MNSLRVITILGVMLGIEITKVLKDFLATTSKELNVVALISDVDKGYISS